MRLLLVLLVLATPLSAETDRAGIFDYYVLSLSWSPNWCALEGDARNAAQCDARAQTGWMLHGLWPQYTRGWPAYCQTAQRAPSRGMTAAMADIMGSSGLAWHQWRKHGTCSGLSARSYFAYSREAFARVTLPEILDHEEKPIALPAKALRDAFLEANPGWSADMLAITCRGQHIQEARLCLSRSLDPQPCGADVLQACTLTDAIVEPVRALPDPPQTPGN